MIDKEEESKYIHFFPSIYQRGKEEKSAFLGLFLKAFEKIISGINDGVKVDGEYLFTWNRITENDNERLKEYFKTKFEVEWVNAVKIETKDNWTIILSDGKNNISLRLNTEKTKVDIEINGIRTDEFTVKIENSDLDIYTFENIEGIEKKLDRIHTYFDPDTTPHDFLKWLAGWVALTLKEGEGWDEQKKRRLITQIVPLYKIRGTRKGLEEYMKIYVGEDVKIFIREFLQPFQINVASTIGVDTMLGEGPPYYFQVYMELPAPDRVMLAKKRKAIVNIINQEKPVHTYYDLKIKVPTMQINVHSTIGEDTLLGGLINVEEE